MKQNLIRKQVIIRFFSVTDMTGQKTGLIFFCQGKFFEVLDNKDVDRALGLPPNQNVVSNF